jgi:hypothetical protein
MIYKNDTSKIDWNYWKLILVFLGGFGVFSLLLGLLPSFSLEALSVGIIITILITGLGLWSWKTAYLFPKFLVAFLFTFQLLGIGIRFWITVFEGLLPWLAILVSGYISAWFFPIVFPKLSEFLWREQTAPRTKVGKILLSAVFSLAPVAGVLGASAGLNISGSDSSRLTDISIASLFSLVATGLSFIFAYQTTIYRRESLLENKEKQGK